MSIILQIETATTSCSVALAKDGMVLACQELNQRNAHAEVITIFIEKVLQTAGYTYAAIDAIAVSCGPGSYTGLRIGISTAKGLCFALDKPLIAVDTLQAMADGMRITLTDQNLLLCPMIDARRMEVYTALFDMAGNNTKTTAAEIIDDHSFAAELASGPVLFFGDGAEKCREALGQNINARLDGSFANSAIHLSAGALQKFRAGNFEDVAYFEPFYLKDFIAGKKKTL